MSEKNKQGFLRKKRTLLVLGYAVSTLPPLMATLSCFPLFARHEDGEAAFSLFSCLLLLLALLPLRRLLRRALRSPAAWQVYLAIFLLFYLTRGIADEMIMISLVGCISAGVGAILLAAARRGERDEGRA